MAETNAIPSLLALSEAVKNTGTELQSIGGKLHMLAAALEKEAHDLAAERATLQSQLAAALAAAENAAHASHPWGVDVCVGIRAPSSSNSTAFRKMGCCTGCGGAANGVGSVVGGVTPAADARVQLSRALSEVAERAEKAASQVRSAAGGGTVVSRRSGGGVGAASRASSSHASQK
ncbi:hypothetical protein P171DRAFT_508641 [Karstenula rhodostoma CBS 690.94]|uniref:Uncharacterized protein n=1 Tax=Karstenula rhodostoma CBS 690.94 TaxID=1392251 RepID=A0A9P4UGE6_9PLEO|nr:hypothetical protein P171DRAFT_508641 [Karstenula rhodostoma CBS 690.94]